MGNVNDARIGNSVIWHAVYSEGGTEVMGFVALKVTFPGFGVGDCERGWGFIKRIKYGQHANLTGVNIDKLSLISNNHKFNKARIKHEELEEL